MTNMGLFSSTTTTRLKIDGMTCGSCVRHVTEALESVSGVKSARVTLDPAMAEVDATAKTTVDRMAKAVADAGYRAEPIEA